MACVRLKRLLSHDPAEAIVVSHKRRCINTGGGDALQEIKEIFRFAGTVHDKDEPVEKILTKVVARGEIKPPIRKSIKTHPLDVLARSKEQQKTISKENRFHLVTALRGIAYEEAAQDVADNTTAPSAFSETVAGLCKLFDVEQYEEPRATVKMVDPITIVCNGIPLQCAEKSVSTSSEHDYVYDLYFTESNNFAGESLQEPVRIEYCDMDELEMLESRSDEDPFADDDDDSNDENNWRNDYPEEDEEFEKQYNFYEGDEELLEQMSEFMIAGRASSEDDDLLSSDEEQQYKSDPVDEQLHGEAYAKFKARMKVHLEESDEDDIDNYESPVLKASQKDELFSL